jgi:hypothetical protein
MSCCIAADDGTQCVVFSFTFRDTWHITVVCYLTGALSIGSSLVSLYTCFVCMSVHAKRVW